jgi:dimethylhistidine N-methyltransferase
MATMVKLTDLHPPQSDMRSEVLAGLCDPDQKTVPCKYLYDARGSELFDRITRTSAYYPTRTELSIFDAHSDAIAEAVGPRAAVVELGSGASLKSRTLLEMLDEPVAYLSAEISRDALLQASQEVAEAFPEIEVQAVCADFTRPLELPEIAAGHQTRLVFFPGSTIGNFTPDGTQEMLARIADLLVDEGDAAIVGADLEKDPAILHRAYNDPEGVTAAFNLNLLDRLNRELSATFDTEQFHHDARYNDDHKRIEMHIVSDREQQVEVASERIHFGAGESIHTENSHKFTTARFASLAAAAGLRLEHAWTDPRRLFSVNLLRRA